MLEILKDGQWHSAEEILVKMQLTENQVKQIADFLHKYGFVTIGEADRIKISKDVQEFLWQTTTP